MTFEARAVDETKEDLRDLLIDFLVSVIREGQDEGDKLKAAELLVKYFIDSRVSVSKRGPLRPATAEVLRLASALEEQADDGR